MTQSLQYNFSEHTLRRTSILTCNSKTEDGLTETDVGLCSTRAISTARQWNMILSYTHVQSVGPVMCHPPVDRY